jgi:hypothetical protein
VKAKKILAMFMSVAVTLCSSLSVLADDSSNRAFNKDELSIEYYSSLYSADYDLTQHYNFELRLKNKTATDMELTFIIPVYCSDEHLEGVKVEKKTLKPAEYEFYTPQFDMSGKRWANNYKLIVLDENGEPVMESIDQCKFNNRQNATWLGSSN